MPWWLYNDTVQNTRGWRELLKLYETHCGKKLKYSLILKVRKSRVEEFINGHLVQAKWVLKYLTTLSLLKWDFCLRSFSSLWIYSIDYGTKWNYFQGRHKNLLIMVDFVNLNNNFVCSLSWGMFSLAKWFVLVRLNSVIILW